MAKVQAKKAAKAAKKSAAKKKAAPKKSPPAKKPAPKKKAAPKPVKKAAPKKAAPKPAPRKAAPKKVAAKKAAPKKAAPKKPAPKKVAKPEKVEKTAKGVVAVAKTAAKTAVKTVVKGVAAVAAAAVPAVTKAAKAVEKRARRPRTRVTSNGPAVANWFSQQKARPSSFIPAPPRAEAPSLVAAPPASSDRLIRPEELHESVVRTVPVRVDIEQGGGKVFISVNPLEATLRPGEGIEWDFRYLGGADVTVDEIVIEFDRPSPFGTPVFKSRKPGAARPHRQMSGAVTPAAAGKRVPYTIRANTAFKSELANTRPALNIVV
jgi:hypothetical protein